MPDGAQATAKHYLQAELEVQIRTNPDMWAFIQESSLDGVWYWDLENPKAEWMSPELWRLLGFDPAEKAHDPAEWQDLIFAEDLEVALENFHAHCADPSHPYDQIVRYRHADGSTVWVRCRGMAIRKPDGTPVRMLGVHNDLTAIYSSSANENEALAAANAELQAVAYALSHDLKSPASTAQMLAKELQTTQANRLDEDGRLLLNLMTETTGRMQLLIDDLLSYAALAGAPEEMTPVDLNTVVAEVLDELEGMVAQHNARIDVAPLPSIVACRRQIRVLLTNLVSNAIKFHFANRWPRVQITSQTTDAGLTLLHVSDNGIGIEENDQIRIFDMFKRLHRTEEYAGNGLGLALCQRIAQNHDGAISVASEPGKGSTFTLSLPGGSR